MSVQKPADFEEFWSNVLEELAGVPIAPELEPIPLRSTEFADTYGVRVTSIGPYRLYGYLSIPKGEGGLFFFPRSSTLKSLHYFLHEKVGWMYYRSKGWIRLEALSDK